MLYTPSPGRGMGDFFLKNPGEPRGGGFKNSEYPGAPGVGDILDPGYGISICDIFSRNDFDDKSLFYLDWIHHQRSHQPTIFHGRDLGILQTNVCAIFIKLFS